MNQFLFPVLATALFAACTGNNKEQGTSSPVSASDSAIAYTPKAQLNLQTGSYEEVDSSGIFMLPLDMGESEKRGKDSYYKNMPANQYWNIVFYNSNDGSVHLLGEQKMLIKQYDVPPNGLTEGQTHPKFIFYHITTTDVNNDKLLNDKDPVYLFATNKEGKGLKQLSPVGYHVKSWTYIKSSGKILMLAIPDSDKNLEFNHEDEVAAFETGTDYASQPREIIAPALKTQIKELFHRDWKRLKH